jgi:hypothetical protein
MEDVTSRLWELAKAHRVQNADLVFGSEIQKLYLLLKSDPPFPPDFEQLLISIISPRHRSLSTTNGHLLGLCCVKYYKSQSRPNYWKFIPHLSDEVKTLSLPAIVVLGLMSRHLCDGFKSQLHGPISFLLTVRDADLTPIICQCFRRIIKGTGTFLTDCVQEIFGFLFCGSSSTDEMLQTECVKSLPAMFINGRTPIKKLLPIIGQVLPRATNCLRFAAAKSLAKLIFHGSHLLQDSNASSATETAFRWAFRIIIQFSRDPRNAETISIAIVIFLRFYAPIEIVAQVRTLSRFMLSFTALRLPVDALLCLTSSVFTAAINVAGSTLGYSLCAQLLDVSKSDMTPRKAIVVLTHLAEFNCSSKTLALAAKELYPQLVSEDKELRRSGVHFFSKLAMKDDRLSTIFLDSFLSYLTTTENDKIGFVQATAAVLLVARTPKEGTIEGLRKVAVRMLDEESNAVHAFLLFSGLVKRGWAGDTLSSCLQYIQSLSNVLSSQSWTAKPLVKILCIYLIFVIETHPKSYEKIIPILSKFIRVVLPMLVNLSRAGIAAFSRWPIFSRTTQSSPKSFS